jgi:hypothetical protein
LFQDINAANVVFSSAMPLWQVPEKEMYYIHKQENRPIRVYDTLDELSAYIKDIFYVPSEMANTNMNVEIDREYCGDFQVISVSGAFGSDLFYSRPDHCVSHSLGVDQLS